jgi:hypothetical protein
VAHQFYQNYHDCEHVFAAAARPIVCRLEEASRVVPRRECSHYASGAHRNPGASPASACWTPAFAGVTNGLACERKSGDNSETRPSILVTNGLACRHDPGFHQEDSSTFIPSFGRPPESKSHNRSSYRSRQCGFVFSINASFHRRFHSLIAFSRRMADAMESCSSYHTRV